MNRFLAALILFGIAIPTLVHGHGFVEAMEIDGMRYSGWLPFADPYSTPPPKRIVRKIPSDSPILDTQDPNLACNVGGNDPSGATANAMPGSRVKFTWNTWPSDHKGPVDVYLASCGALCDNFKAADAKWFAIDKRGFADGVWASDILVADNASFTTTLPSNLAPGAYLMRHSILAMHSVGQPQFYPSCSQILVGGHENGRPLESETVKTSQLYQGTTFPNIWSMLSCSTYTIPGPNIASFITPTRAPPPPSTSQCSSAALPTSTALPIGSKASKPYCRLKRREPEVGSAQWLNGIMQVKRGLSAHRSKIFNKR